MCKTHLQAVLNTATENWVNARAADLLGINNEYMEEIPTMLKKVLWQEAAKIEGWKYQRSWWAEPNTNTTLKPKKVHSWLEDRFYF